MFCPFFFSLLATLFGALACPLDCADGSNSTASVSAKRVIVLPVSAAAYGGNHAPQVITEADVDDEGASVGAGAGSGATLNYRIVARKPTPSAANDDDDDEPADDDEAAEQPIPGGGPWLGIQFGPIPEALVAHLNAKNGMILLNVAKDSPADQAGLQQYDIVLSIDGHAMTNEAKDLAERVKQFHSDQKIGLQLIRGGKQQTVPLTVGIRPDNWQKLEYKYAQPPEIASARFQAMSPQLYMLQNGKLLAPDADAMKQWKNLLPQLRSSEKALAGSLKELKGRSVIVIHKTDDGKTIEIRSEGEGKIKVARTEKGGDKTSQVYAGEEELKNSDPEAYKVYDESRANVGSGAHWKAFGNGWNFNWNDADFDKQMKQALEAYQNAAKSVGRNGKAMEKARKLFQAHIRDAIGSTWNVRVNGTSFHQHDDGSIDVITRTGGDELVRTFKNEETLKREQPDLYKRYAEMRSTQEEPANK